MVEVAEVERLGDVAEGAALERVGGQRHLGVGLEHAQNVTDSVPEPCFVMLTCDALLKAAVSPIQLTL